MCTYICVYVYWTCTCIHVYVYICMCVYTYIYIHLYPSLSLWSKANLLKIKIKNELKLYMLFIIQRQIRNNIWNWDSLWTSQKLTRCLNWWNVASSSFTTKFTTYTMLPKLGFVMGIVSIAFKWLLLLAKTKIKSERKIKLWQRNKRKRKGKWRPSEAKTRGR